MTHADFNDLETRDYIFKIGDRGKGIQARYDENTDALIFPRAAFDYVYDLLKEALSQEPCEKCEVGNPCLYCEHEFSQKIEPCDDAISREAVMRLIENKPYDWSNLTERHNMLMEIRKLPSVTQKSGKWIEKDGFDGDVYYDCSECGESWATIEGTPWDNEWKYCPNCGAKMVEPQESEANE